MGQSCEEEMLVWVFPNHESKTSDLEKPILALPIHRIDIPEKLKKWHQEEVFERVNFFILKS